MRFDVPGLRFFAALAFSMLTLFGCSTYEPTGNTTIAQLSRETILKTVNAVRLANGREPLAYSASLATVAQSQAQTMAVYDKLSHEIGGTLRQRTNVVGYRGAVGENVASGQTTLEQALEGWLNSPAHRNTLLSPNFTEFGLAAATSATGKNYWAMVFGGDSANFLSAL